MATNEIIFTIGTDTGDSAAEVQQMQQALEGVNEELQEVGQNTEKALGDLEQEAKEAAKALESPATRLEQMRNEMIRIGQADPRFQELAAEAATKRFQLVVIHPLRSPCYQPVQWCHESPCIHETRYAEAENSIRLAINTATEISVANTHTAQVSNKF